MEDAAAKESAVFVTHFNALSTQRGITTRRLAQAQDNPEVTKTAQLAKVFRTIFNDVVSAKGTCLCTYFFEPNACFIVFKLVFLIM